MVKSNATRVDEYLNALPPDRQAIIRRMRQFILDHLPPGYEEILDYGMLVYAVPLNVLPDTYNKHPLGYIALASQKNYNSLYLMTVYGDLKLETAFHEAYLASGKKLNMGKSCLRFQTVDDLPLDLLAKTIGQTSMQDYIASYRLVQSRRNKR